MSVILESILVAGYIALLAVAAGYAFARPSGIYWRSAAGIAGVAIAGALIWQLASPTMAAEAGLGAFALWCAAVALALVVGVCASVAATVRHLCNAAGARLAP
jgi:hypothetical protein